MYYEWAESVQRQCAAANVPFFMKQFGSKPRVNYEHWLKSELSRGQMTIDISGIKADGDPARAAPFILRDSKGGDPSEWPKSLRVREFPTVREAVTA